MATVRRVVDLDDIEDFAASVVVIAQRARKRVGPIAGTDRELIAHVVADTEDMIVDILLGHVRGASYLVNIHPAGDHDRD